MGRLLWQITKLAESKGMIPKAVRVGVVPVRAAGAVAHIAGAAARAVTACVDAGCANSAPKR